MRGTAAIAGYEEWSTTRRAEREAAFELDQWAELAQAALSDAGIGPKEVDGLMCTGVREATKFAPSTLAEYLGFDLSFAERLDHGGAGAVGMIGRAALAIEAGLCSTVVCAIPWGPTPSAPGESPTPRFDFGATSRVWGAPQAEFDAPYGNVGQNAGYALVARLYAERYGSPEAASAKAVVDLRQNAMTNPGAAFHGIPITTEEILDSPMIAEPLRLYDIVMPCYGGSAVVVTSLERARDSRHRPVCVTGFGERIRSKSPTYAEDMLDLPAKQASAAAFASAGITASDIDVTEVYDCYTISALTNLEAAGFCGEGEGASFLESHDLTWRGDFPLNTHGGQLGCGQPGLAGGMSLAIEAARQISGRAEGRQVRDCETAYVSGTGGVMSVQAALILQGDRG